MDNQTVFKQIRLNERYHALLVVMAEEQHRSMANLTELLIQKEWDATHPQPWTIDEELERR
jgi:hypothetical protein